MSKYAIFRMKRMKTSKDLDDAYKHNERLYHVENADPTKMQDNIELIDTFGLTYEDLVRSELTDLKMKGVDQRTIRKDAVQGFEILLSFSREQMGNINIEEWAAANLAWLDKTFNPPDHQAKFIDKETGKEKTIELQNLKHVVVHMDESKPHIHAFIVPIDDKGHLNSHYYNRGRGHLMAMQTDYAQAMSQFDLIRGELHSTATPQQMTRYYNHIVKAVEAELPPPEPNETAEEYKKRADEIYQQALSAHRNEIVKKDQEIIQAKSQSFSRLQAVQQEAAAAKESVEKIYQETGQSGMLDVESIRNVGQMVKDAFLFKRAVEHYPDKEFAENILANYDRLVAWEAERERQEQIKNTEIR